MKKPVECDVLIAGGGVAGLSTAWHLAQGPGKLRVVVVEREKKLGGHSSGRNAGMIRQALSDPLLVRLAREGREALERASQTKSWKKLGLKTAGSVLLDDDPKSAELRKTATALNAEGISVTVLPASEAETVVPPMFGAGTFAQALFCQSDAVLDIHELVAGFERELKRLGVQIICGTPIRSVRKKGTQFHVAAHGREFRAQVIVNAAGAWASEIGQLAGASAVPLTAYRRHLYETPALPGVSKRAPFVWHVSRGFYFRPLGAGFLISPCDKTPLPPTSGEAVDPGMAQMLVDKLSAISPRYRKIKLTKARSGLRTMAPDGRFVIGVDPDLFGFFWVAGLGGHGVTTCFSVGRLAADLILGHKVDSKLQKAFSPARFAS